MWTVRIGVMYVVVPLVTARATGSVVVVVEVAVCVECGVVDVGVVAVRPAATEGGSARPGVDVPARITSVADPTSTIATDARRPGVTTRRAR
jgi:hypothetical protein